MKLSVFDLHCDTASALFESDTGLKRNTLHIDLTRATALDGYAQCFACFTTSDPQILRGRKAEDLFEVQLHTILREIYENRDRICLAYTAEDIRLNREKGLISAILTIEGAAGFGYDPAMLEMLFKAGFRISSLGWNERNVLLGSNKTGGGLTDLGREYVKEAQRLGMLIDVSHCSDEAFWDILEMTQEPILATHSNSRAICDHSRNLTDDMFRAICRTGGVAGFNQYAAFVGDRADLDTVCDHIFHLLELDPEGKHIALGGDLDGCQTLCEGFTGIESYPALAHRLLQRGLAEDTLHDIFWNNAMGVMEGAVRNNQRSE